MARLGVVPAARHVDRARLLDALPDTAPFVVTLEAPAGFGKTSLALDWAAALSRDGWRVLHVSQRGRDLRAAVATALGFEPSEDWGAVELALWSEPSLLVVDDLDQAECSDQLELMLTGLDGLLVLVSRRPLSSPQLVAAALRGRLMTLGPQDLSFSHEEASTLFEDPAAADAASAESGGWPLLLAHVANVGSLPAPSAIASAVRSGVSDIAWRRLLLQAAVPDATAELGGEADRVAVEELEAAGFVTTADGVLAVPAVVVRALLGACLPEVRRAVAAARGLLSERQLCAAHEATRDLAALASVLDTASSPLERDDPRSLLRWHGLVPAGAGGRRSVRVGNALCAVGRRTEGIALLREIAGDDALDADLRLTALGDAIYYLAEAPSDRDDARRLLQGSDALFASASPERQGRFLSTASAIYFRAGDYTAARALVERALAVLPPGNKHRYAPLINLAVLEWNLSGDIEARIRLEHEGLEICREAYPDHVVGVCRDLAQLCLYVGWEGRAREYLAEGERYAHSRPILALEVAAMQAQLDGNLERLADVADRARGTDDPAVLDAVASRLATAVTASGDAAGAARLFADQGAGGFAALATALALLAIGEVEEAERRVAAARDDDAEREFRLAWQAARYRVGRSPEDLETLCAMTSAGPRILPYFVPLSELPTSRPDLATYYPLEDIMRSGWREATAKRLPELPPLFVTALGEMTVAVLGERVEVSGRQRDLLALLLLGLGRRDLSAALWPEANPAKARNNLNVQLNELRRVIEPWGHRTYLFEDGLHNTEADLYRLRAALAAGRHDDVMSLYRGRFAPGAATDVVAEARTALEREVADSLVEAASCAPPRKAAAYLKRALELEPLNEDALQKLLALLVASGRRGEALRRYRWFAADLGEQLGLEPLPDTTRLVLRALPAGDQ